MAKSSQWKKFRNFLLISTSVFAFAGDLSFHPTTELKEDIKQENTSIPIYKIDAPIQTISFRNDTLDHYASALLTYHNNQIIRNFVNNSNQHRMQLPYFVHEQRHHHNKGYTYWSGYHYSPSQFIQIRMHEEISANIAAILTADLEYQLMDDKEAVIKKYDNGYMKFYFDAIKDGIIKPESTDSADLDTKYTLLVNGAIRMWEQKFRAHYTPSLISSLRQYLVNYGIHKPNKDNYRRALSHFYSLGGIDLSTYIKNDAQFIDIKIKLCNELVRVKSFYHLPKHRRIVMDEIFNYGDQLKYFSDAKRPSAIQHLFMAAKIKCELEKINDYALEANNKAISAAYRKVMYDLSHDINFKQMVWACADFKMIRVPFNDEPDNFLRFFPISNLLTDEDFEIVRSFYQFRNIDLTSLIKDFDVNSMPLDEITMLTFMKEATLNNLINKIPQTLYTTNRTDTHEVLKDASLNQQTTFKGQPSKEARRLSGDLFVAIPNFEEPLLVANVLTADARRALKELFDDYQQIPEVFKNCDIKSTKTYIRRHGHSHYFENKDAPFKPLSKSKKKKNSADMQALHQIQQAQK